ncbi:MAG: hypothetical protein HZA46_15315 [Planctomycetales bacterium]|nr:hypothetical protein [Planctomycetales bacterium]
MKRRLILTAATCLMFASHAAVQAQFDAPAKSAAEQLNRQWSHGRAEGRGPVKLVTFPLRVEDISYINPMGMMASGHTTPTDHLYLVAKESPDKDKLYDVLAVADGRVVVIQWRPNPTGKQPDPTVFNRAVDLKVTLEHAATCWSYVDHLVELDPVIQKQVGSELKPGQPVSVRIPVQAGQVIGKVRGGFTFDFALIDTTVTNQGFVVPDQFLKRDPHKLHAVDPFDYIDEPLRTKLLSFNARKSKPLGGRIDYDIDGKLVGNWYREGTGGYAGLNRRWDYWVGHLTFAYHHIDPTQVLISMGDVDGRARQFAVRGNAPDPAKIGTADGLIKYNLIAPSIDSRTGKPLASFEERFFGVLLVRVLEDRNLKLEVFPGMTLAEARDFTAGAAIYER